MGHPYSGRHATAAAAGTRRGQAALAPLLLLLELAPPWPAVAASPTTFHAVRSTRWPCLQFGLPCGPVASNAFAGALIMCNDTAVDKDGLACCSALHYADPLDPKCYTTPTEVRDALASTPAGHKLIGTVDGESDMGGPTLTYHQFWDPLDGVRIELHFLEIFGKRRFLEISAF